MYACILEIGGEFFEGVCAPCETTVHSSDPPLRFFESLVRLTFVTDDGTLRIAQEQEEVGGVEGGYRQGERRHRHLGRDSHAVLVC